MSMYFIENAYTLRTCTSTLQKPTLRRLQIIIIRIRDAERTVKWLASHSRLFSFVVLLNDMQRYPTSITTNSFWSSCLVSWRRVHLLEKNGVIFFSQNFLYHFVLSYELVDAFWSDQCRRCTSLSHK